MPRPHLDLTFTADIDQETGESTGNICVHLNGATLGHIGSASARKNATDLIRLADDLDGAHSSAALLRQLANSLGATVVPPQP